MLRLVTLLAGLVFGGFLAAPASANTIANFSLIASLSTPTDNDGLAIGTFSLDLTAHTIVAASITTQTGVFIFGTHYPGFSADTYSPIATGTELVFRNSSTAVPGVAGQLLTLKLPFTDLTDFSTLPTFLALGDESVYFALCGGLCATRSVFGAAITLSVTETPIPAALPLLATALGGLGAAAWRRKRAHQGDRCVA
ncbi:hypothetical protein [Dongia sp.]|uniref:hypothetical protein n=1 Tax=Dongia sp. TaxID=1977262 RepID=UPI003751B00B